MDRIWTIVFALVIVVLNILAWLTAIPVFSGAQDYSPIVKVGVVVLCAIFSIASILVIVINKREVLRKR